MFDHVTIRVSDRAASEGFYSTVLATLGVEQTHSGAAFSEWDDFSLAAADAEQPVTRRLHIGFSAPSHAHVDAFWRAGVDAGWRSDGEPRPRPQYRDDYYGAPSCSIPTARTSSSSATTAAKALTPSFEGWRISSHLPNV